MIVLAVLAVIAGAAHAQGDRRASPLDPQAKVPPLEFRSAFEGYRLFADQGKRSWREANEDVGAAGGYPGHRPGQGPGEQTSKPQPGKTPSPGGHGAHK